MADLGRLRFSGFVAWVFWWLIHIMFLVGFRNRILVIFSWAWSYVTYQRGARLITGKTPALPRVGTGASSEAETVETVSAVEPVVQKGA